MAETIDWPPQSVRSGGAAACVLRALLLAVRRS